MWVTFVPEMSKMTLRIPHKIINNADLATLYGMGSMSPSINHILLDFRDQRFGIYTKEKLDLFFYFAWLGWVSDRRSFDLAAHVTIGSDSV